MAAALALLTAAPAAQAQVSFPTDGVIAAPVEGVPAVPPGGVTARERPPTTAECATLFERHPGLARPRDRSGIFDSGPPRPGSPAARAETCHAMLNTGAGKRSPFADVPGPDYLRRDQPDLPDTMAPAADPKARATMQLRIADRYSKQAQQFAIRGQWPVALKLYEFALQYAPHDIAIRRNIAEARRQVALQAAERRLKTQQR